MRISEWSSDVCSSDLIRDRSSQNTHRLPGSAGRHYEAQARRKSWFHPTAPDGAMPPGRHAGYTYQAGRPFRAPGKRILKGRIHGRSEEHTSELQSLMRISYAVFCLKKKKQTKHTLTQHLS